MVASFAALCVLAAAAPSLAGEPEAPSAAPGPAAAVDLSGRWEGRSFELTRARTDCGDKPCTLTLDLARCAGGWCGIEVLGREQRCGATALRLDEGATRDGSRATLFKGTLELAAGTEPYVVEVYLRPRLGDEPGQELEITGDTGGAFRVFRRSFPFNATLARTREAQCRPESTVSLLD